MSLWKRLLGSREPRRAVVTEAGQDQQPLRTEQVRALPTVRFDPSRVTERVRSDLRSNVQRIKEFDGSHVDLVYEAALRSIVAGRDMASLFNAIMQMNIEGMTKKRAEAITVLLHNKATSIINRERQESLGMGYAVWLYSGSPCHKNPKKPSQADIRRDVAHHSVDGKRFQVSKGLLIDGKWTYPGEEEGCRCVSRAVVPGLD